MSLLLKINREVNKTVFIKDRKIISTSLSIYYLFEQTKISEEYLELFFNERVSKLAVPVQLGRSQVGPKTLKQL